MIGWGGTGNKRFALLSPHQPPPPSYLLGATTTATSAMRGGPWSGAATLCGLEALPTYLALMHPRLGPRRQHRSQPSPPSSSPRMKFIAHAMRVWSNTGGYGT